MKCQGDYPGLYNEDEDSILAIKPGGFPIFSRAAQDNLLENRQAQLSHCRGKSRARIPVSGCTMRRCCCRLEHDVSSDFTQEACHKTWNSTSVRASLLYAATPALKSLLLMRLLTFANLQT